MTAGYDLPGTCLQVLWTAFGVYGLAMFDVAAVEAAKVLYHYIDAVIWPFGHGRPVCANNERTCIGFLLTDSSNA